MTSGPLQLEIRLSRLLVGGYGSSLELRWTLDSSASVQGMEVEVLCEGLSAQGDPASIEPKGASSGSRRLAIRPERPGAYPAEIRVVVRTSRGRWEACGELPQDLVVLEKPASLQSLNVTIQEKAFFGAIAEGIELGKFESLNDLLQHDFAEAEWQPLSLNWTGFPVTRDLKEGKIFAGRFKLERRLGQGGMGVVWLALDQSLRGEPVALKFLPEEICHDPGAIDDLRDEVLKARKLRHDHIVAIHDLIEADGTAAISMEFIDGMTLDEARRKQPNRVYEVATLQPLLKPLCEALDYAHQRGLIHYDIKPSNLMLTSEGVLKVCDFGLSGALCESASRRSKPGQTTGTTPYMSPQALLLGTRAVSDDVYSLGATLYELLTGKPPFFRGSLEHQIESVVPPSIAERRTMLAVEGEAVPEEWEQWIAACLSKEVRDRRLADLRTLSNSNPKESGLPNLGSRRPESIGDEQTGSSEGRTSENMRPSSQWVRTFFLFLFGGLGVCLLLIYMALRLFPGVGVSSASDSRSGDPQGGGFFSRVMSSTKSWFGGGWLNSKPGEKKGLSLPGGVTMSFRYCPPGDFLMGSSEQEPFRSEDENRVAVGLDSGFWIAETECTQGQWMSLVGENPSEFGGDPDRPVESVTWTEANQWIEKANLEGLAPTGWRWALPSEALWEYACRAGTTTAYSFGEDHSDLYLYGNSMVAVAKGVEASVNDPDGVDGQTASVGSYRANPWGIYDMHGNVWEMCLDLHRDGRGGVYSDGVHLGLSPVIRGGGWDAIFAAARSASRRDLRPNDRSSSVGFRPVLIASPVVSEVDQDEAASAEEAVKKLQ